LGRSSDQARQDEILGSKQDLEALLGHPVTIMAYPYGSYDEEVKKLVAKNGFQMAFATTLGSLHAPSSLLELRRVRVLDGEKLGPILERFSQK
jgi:peptidoglycan/xylan/chitin deacetylase (PgdA/CDA1 family)